MVEDIGQVTGAVEHAPTKPNPIERLIGLILQVFPLLFGLGFLTPLIAQSIIRIWPETAHAAWPLYAGLAVGGGWGALANIRGRWL
jgi:hypothetical protein